MKELTYILGAGASYQSIPVVKTFNKRFLEFIDSLKTNNGNVWPPEYRPKMANAIDYLTELSKEFSSHQSFDTYFKKLFHFGKHDKINLGKRLLNLYFMWEHSQSSPPLAQVFR